MSRTTFHEWVKIKDGRRCSEEVVAKGKGHARKTGRRRRGRARRRPIKEQSACASSVQWSGTALPPMGVRWVWQGTVCSWLISLGWKNFILFYFIFKTYYYIIIIIIWEENIILLSLLTLLDFYCLRSYGFLYTVVIRYNALVKIYLLKLSTGSS